MRALMFTCGVLLALPAAAFNLQPTVTTGCHEAITRNALEHSGWGDGAVAPAPTRDDQALRDNVPFDAEDIDAWELAQLIGVRENDLAGVAPTALKAFAVDRRAGIQEAAPPTLVDPTTPPSEPTSTTPPPLTPPAATPPTPAPLSDDEPRAAPAPTPRKGKAPTPPGMDPLLVAGVQIAAGSGACCVGCCVAVPVVIGVGMVPIVGAYLGSVVSGIIIGAAIGGTEAVVGDMLGQQRAPLAWPMLASSGILLAGTAASLVVGVVAQGALNTAPTNPNELLAQMAPYAIAQVGIQLGTIGLAIAVPAVVYGMTAVDKKPGDTGKGLPGLFSPDEPIAAAPGKTEASTAALAMRF